MKYIDYKLFCANLCLLLFFASARAQWQQAGEKLLERGEARAALHYFERVYAERVTPEAHLKMAECYIALGRADSARLILSEYETAESYRAQVQETLGLLHAGRNDWNRALYHFSESQIAYTALNEPERCVRARLQTGDCLLQLGASHSALEQYQAADLLLESYADLEDPDFVRIYTRYAQVRSMQGDTLAALHWLRKARSLHGAFHAERPLLAVAIYRQWAACTAKPEEREQYLRQALQAAASTGQPVYGALLVELGELTAAAGRTQEAENLFKNALEFFAKYPKGSRFGRSLIYANKARLRYEEGRIVEVLELYNRALLQLVQQSDQDGSQRTDPYMPPPLHAGDLGSFAELEQALTLLADKNQALLEGLVSTDVPKTVLAHTALGDSLLREGLLFLPLSHARAERLTRLAHRLCLQAMIVLPDSAVASAFAYTDFYHSLRHRLPFFTEPDKAWGLLPDSLRSLDWELSSEAERLWEEMQAAFETPGKEDYAFGLEVDYLRAKAQKQAFLDSLLAGYPLHYRLRYANQGTDLQTLSATLQADEFWVQFLQGETGVYVFAVGGGRAKLHFAAHSGIRAALELVERTVSTPNSPLSADFFAAGQLLYEKLLSPHIGERLAQGGLRLTIAGDLWRQAPPAAWSCSPASAERPDYLVQHFPLRYSPSAHHYLHFARPRPQPGRNLFLVAPDYDSLYWALAPQAELVEPRRSLPAQPWVANAKRALDDAYYGQFLSGGKACEAKFKNAELDHYPVVHLMGYADRGDAPDGWQNRFFMTEDGQEEEDDVLYVEELSRLDLSQCNLFVLNLFNQGAWILEPALLAGGASCLLGNMRPAEGQASAELLSDFYEALKGDIPKSHALQKVQMERIRKNQHPFFWASTMLIGDDAPLALYRQSSQGREVLWGIVIGSAFLAWYLIGHFRQTYRPAV